MAEQNFIFTDISDGLVSLATSVLQGGEVGSRNGRVAELCHIGVTYDQPLRREVLVEGRKASIAAQIAEAAWVMAGRNDIEWLSAYLPRAADFSDDGKTWRAGYGTRMRKFGADWLDNDGVDQLDEVVKILLADPLSRRAVISLSDPTTDFLPTKDVNCNREIQFTSRLGYLDAHVFIRSNDLVWGHCTNQFIWSVLLEVVANCLGVKVGHVHYSIGSLHIYQPFWEKARAYRTGDFSSATPSPRFNLNGKVNEARSSNLDKFDSLLEDWFEIERMIREDGPSEARWQVENFREPMLKSWLRVLQWYWSGDDVYLTPLVGTRLEIACRLSPKPPGRPDATVPHEGDSCPKCHKAVISTSGGRTPLKCIGAWCNHVVGTPIEPEKPEVSEFLKEVFALHCEKHAAYGDSWMKRGELFSIIPNIARKVDRLASGADTSDETQTDTAIDLLVYLAKYKVFLVTPENASDPHVANALMAEVEKDHLVPALRDTERIAIIEQLFETLLKTIEDNPNRNLKDVTNLVDAMLSEAYELAAHRWETQGAGDDYKADLNQ